MRSKESGKCPASLLGCRLGALACGKAAKGVVGVCRGAIKVVEAPHVAVEVLLVLGVDGLDLSVGERTAASETAVRTLRVLAPVPAPVLAKFRPSSALHARTALCTTR